MCDKALTWFEMRVHRLFEKCGSFLALTPFIISLLFTRWMTFWNQVFMMCSSIR